MPLLIAHSLIKIVAFTGSVALTGRVRPHPVRLECGAWVR